MRRALFIAFLVLDSHDKKRSIFRKIRSDRTHRCVKLHRLRTGKTERLRYEKIDPDPYAKRTAGRAAETPARRSHSVGPTSRAPQAHARRPLEYSHLAIPGAYGACARPPFAPSPSSDPSRAALESFIRTIAMYHQVHTYTELQQQIHDDLRIQHPEWVKPNGESPRCDSYDACLTEMLDTLTRRGSNRPIGPPHRALEPAVTGS
jgi:hypothetical protein